MRFVILVLAAAVGFGLGILFSQTLQQENTDSAILPTEREYTSVSICDEILAGMPQDELDVFTDNPAAVDFTSNSDAALFRTTITEQAKEGPNFAGHYTVATWGCGTECEGYAIIDTITGKIVVYEPYIAHKVSDGLIYSLDSNILTLNPKSTNEKYLESIKGKTAAEMIQEDFEAHKARIYYRLVESSDRVFLSEICVENILDGTF